MNEIKLFAFLQNIEEKLEENNRLLENVNDKLKVIGQEASSIRSHTDFTYDVKNATEEISEILKEKLN